MNKEFLVIMIILVSMVSLFGNDFVSTEGNHAFSLKQSLGNSRDVVLRGTNQSQPTPITNINTSQQDRRFDLSSFGDRSNRKSALGAMAMSAAVPGAGQFYLGQNTKAGIMVTAEMLAVFSLLRFNKEMNILTDDFKMYAHANAGLRRGASDEIYKHAANWRSSEEFHTALRLWARNRFLIILNDPDAYERAIEFNSLDPNDTWAWESDAHFRQYRSIRREKQNYEIYRNFAAGAMIINRIVSVIDSAVFANRINNDRTRFTSIPDFDRQGVTFNYEIKF